MSIAAVMGRIQSIQAVIQQLSSPVAPAGTAGQATPVDAPAGATQSTFGAVLNGALTAAPTVTSAPGTAVTAATGGMVANGATGADVVADAKRYLGVPYVFGGTTTAGLDCSGLVQRVFRDLGVAMPRVVVDQMRMGAAVPSIADAKPGDLIVADGGGHIAIYAGDGKIIEAPHPGMDVLERKDWITPGNTVTIRRIVPSGAS